jgi:hypothetical protein
MDDWISWIKMPPEGHEIVEWVRLDNRGLSAVHVNRLADLHAAWDSKQWNLAAIYWRPAKSNVVPMKRHQT